MRKFVAAVISSLLFSTQAMAGSPPAAPVVAQALAPGFGQLAVPTNTLFWHPFTNGLGTVPYQTYALGVGSTAHLAAELKAAPQQGRLMVASQAATDIFSITQAVVSSSSGYGPLAGVSTTRAGGNTPYDQAGNALSTMIPITWNNGGSCSGVTPWTGLNSAFTGVPASTGTQVLAMTEGTAAASGASSLILSASATPEGLAPFAGMYIQVGSGAIPAGTKIGTFSASSNTATLVNVSGSSVSTTAAVAAGTQVFLSYQPLTLASPTIGPSTNVGEQQWKCSDWFQLPASYYRLDGGFVPGMSVSVSGVTSSGTTLKSLTPNTITLSSPTTGTNGSSPAVSIYVSPTLVSLPSPGSQWLYLSSLFGVQLGQVVSASGVAANSYVSEIDPTKLRVRISNTAGAVSPISPTNMAAGETVTISNVTYPAYGAFASAGVTTFSVPSTSTKPLLEIRVAAAGTSSGNTVPILNPGLLALTERQNAGMSNVLINKGPSAVDDINVITAGTNANSYANGALPVWGIQYTVPSRGYNIGCIGDSMYAGKTTPADSSSFCELAAEALSTPSRPVEAVNIGYSGNNGHNYWPMAHNLIAQNLINVALFQGYTHNGGDTPQSYLDTVSALSSEILTNGGRAILGTEFPRQMTSPASFIVASSGAVASTSVPITGYINYNASSVLITDQMGLIPAGTTATLTYQTAPKTINVSTAVTLPAGDVLYLNAVTVGSAGVSGSTSVPLATNVGVNSAPVYVSGGGLPAGTYSQGFSPGASSITLSSAATIPAGTILTLSNFDATTSLPFAQAALALDRQFAKSSSFSFFDAYTCLEDPTNPDHYLLGTSEDGVHANWEKGHPMLAACFKPVLQSVIGQ